MNSHLFMLLLYFAALFAADAQNPLADLEPERYFDFWIGEWELTWIDADGTEAKGKNIIRRILNGNVLEENFTATSGQYDGFVGRSWSVYNKRLDTWSQTWVDNNGGYLDFTGEIEGEKRIFKREGVDPQGRQIMQRMVFHDITDDSLTWDWEVSYDEGETWTLRWRIYYHRIK